MDKSRIRNEARMLMDSQSGLRDAQRDYEAMSRLDWKPPAPLSTFAWIRPRVSPAPYDALRGAVTAFSNFMPRFTVHPLTVCGATKAKDDRSLEAKELANKWEHVFMWLLEDNLRRNPSFLADIVWSAVLYDEINGRPLHLPTQWKATKRDPGAREKASQRYGDYLCSIEDPKTVHVRYSSEMAEAVLGVTLRRARDIARIWNNGEVAAKIKNKKDHADEFYVEFDWVDYERRYAWCVETPNPAEIEDKGITLFEPAPWLREGVPLLPWINVAGGTKIDVAPEHQRKPLLYAVRQAQMWANSSIMGTIQMSQAIAEAAAPRNVVKGPGAEDVEIQYGEPGGRINLTPFQVYERIQQLGLDPQVQAAYATVEEAMKRSTTADVLVTGQPLGQNQPFAGYNLQVLQAIASLGRWRSLAERFIERWAEHTLLMCHYTGGEIVGYEKGDNPYIIDSEDIDPENLHIKVELTNDAPTDRVQRVTAAMNLSQSPNLQMSPRSLLEYLGVTDPEAEIGEWKRHQLDMADFRGRLQRIESIASGQLEQMAAQMAQGMIEQQMQEAQGQGPLPNNENPPGIQGVGGQGFNPAAGGMPPAMASPEGNTFENQRGMTREGAELA